MYIFKSSFFFLGLVLILGLLMEVPASQSKKCAKDCRAKNKKGKPGPNDRICGETPSHYMWYEDKCEMNCSEATEVQDKSKCKDTPQTKYVSQKPSEEDRPPPIPTYN